MSEVEQAVDNLKLLLRTEWPYVAVPVSDLQTVLARLAELEADAKPEPDTLSTLKVGDKVEVLIDWGTVYKGTRGRVKDIISDEFTIQVMLPGQITPVGYRRSEVSKVAN